MTGENGHESYTLFEMQYFKDIDADVLGQYLYWGAGIEENHLAAAKLYVAFYLSYNVAQMAEMSDMSEAEFTAILEFVEMQIKRQIENTAAHRLQQEAMREDQLAKQLDNESVQERRIIAKSAKKACAATLAAVLPAIPMDTLDATPVCETLPSDVKDYFTSESEAQKQAVADTYCPSCKFQAKCLEHAARSTQVVGVFGGLFGRPLAKRLHAIRQENAALAAAEIAAKENR